MLRWLSIGVFILAIFCCQPDLWAAARRNSADVRRERSRTERESEATRRRIRENTERTERELRRLEALQAQIEESERRESRLGAKVDSITNIERTLNDSISILGNRVERLEQNYNASLRAIRRQRQSASPLAFIFSAESFSQAISRIRYLNDLAVWNATQGQQLREERQQLEVAIEHLNSARISLQRSRDELQRTREALEQDRENASATIRLLRDDVDELNRVLRAQQERSEQLDAELSRVIEAEEAERREEEERLRREDEQRRIEAERRRLEAERQRAEEERRRLEQRADSAENPDSVQPEEPQQQVQPLQTPAPNVQPQVRSAAEITAAFEANRGKLQIPVSGQATIVSNFGRRTHTALSRVEVQNNGIDIEARQGAKARAVFDGTVSMIIIMDGYRNVILLRHGEYLTVYAGIDALDVRKGDVVQAGQSLGTLYTHPDDEHGTRLHFEVRHEKNKLNPRDWLKSE